MNKLWAVIVYGVGVNSVYLVRDAETAGEAIRKLDYGQLPFGWTITAKQIKFDEDDVAEIV